MKKAGRPETGSFVLNFHQQIPFRPCILILHAPLIAAFSHPPLLPSSLCHNAASRYGVTSGRRRIVRRPLENSNAGICRTVNPCRKAVLKTRAVQTLRDCRTPSNCAKRLDCGVFTAAFDLANGAMFSPCHFFDNLGRPSRTCHCFPTNPALKRRAIAVHIEIDTSGQVGRAVLCPPLLLPTSAF
jgi:hypothetical protein